MEQVQKEYGDPQVTSYVDTNNYFWIKTSSSASHPFILGFSFNHYFYIMLECPLSL
jgi:hypothetical protein